MIPQDFGGAALEGRWLSKSTGNIVTVTNHIYDGDECLLSTSHGFIPLSKFMDEYVQIGDDDKHKEDPVDPAYKEQHIAAELDSTMDFDYDALIAKKATKHSEVKFALKDESAAADERKNAQQQPSAAPSTTIKNETLIEKFFNNLETKPKFSLCVDWDDFPTAELRTLVHYLDVSVDDIAKYIVEKLCPSDEISESIKNTINEKIK